MKNRSGKKFMIIGSTIASTLLVAIFVPLTASGIFSKPKYLEPWNKSYSQKYDDPRTKLACYGLLAANGHNMQPWKIKLDKNKDAFYLFADSERLTKEVDPLARQTMISQGTFLEYVRIAGEELGYKTDIILFPDGDYDEQNLYQSMKNKAVAKIILTKIQPKNNLLYDYMFLPDTNRGAYNKTKLTAEEIRQIQGTNIDQDLTVKIFQDEENNSKFGDYAIEGAKIESSIHRISEESANIFRANENEKNKFRFGFSIEGQGARGIMKHVLQGIITIVPSINNEKTSAEAFVKATELGVENTPAYALIISEGNSRTQQIKSGMLYSRLILKAHSLGFVMHPPSQVLEEYHEMKDAYSRIHNDYAKNGSTIQMFFRLGKPTKEAPQSMRRDVMDLIE